MIIDTHAHLFLNQFDNDRDKMIEDCINNNISKIILPNIDENSISPMLELVNKYNNILYPTLGLHPCSVDADYKNKLKTIFDTDVEIVAIGEIGIDLYWDKTFIKQQIEAFEEQINIALKFKLPIIIHSRSSFNEVYEMLKMYKNTELQGVMHCFSGNVMQAKKIIELGYYLGIGGTLTYKNSNLVDVVKNVPLSNCLLETDSPFLSPMPDKGKRNDPTKLKYIIKTLSAITNLDEDKIEDITANNAIKLFKQIVY